MSRKLLLAKQGGIAGKSEFCQANTLQTSSEVLLPTGEVAGRLVSSNDTQGLWLPAGHAQSDPPGARDWGSLHPPGAWA